MFKVIYCLLLICVGTSMSFFASAASHVPAPTKILEGEWLVEQVLIDQKADNGLPGHYNIPKYLGRIFTIKPSIFSINKPEDEVCNNPTYEIKNLLLSQVIAKSIESRAFTKGSVLIEDMQLKTNDQRFQFYYLSCDKQQRVKNYGMAAEDDLSNVVWLIKLSENKMAISWHDQTILVLSPILQKQEIKASFNCDKAETSLERKICSDLGLALFDQSVSEAYHSNMAYYRSQENASQLITFLKANQRKWLKSRDECKINDICLRTKMDKRIDSLIYDLSELMYEQR